MFKYNVTIKSGKGTTINESKKVVVKSKKHLT